MMHHQYIYVIINFIYGKMSIQDILSQVSDFLSVRRPYPTQVQVFLWSIDATQL